MTLQTNDLVKILAKTPPVEKPASFLMALISLAFFGTAVTFMIMGDLRPGLWTLTLPIGFYIKTTLLLGFAFIGVVALGESAKPLPTKTHTHALWIFPITLAALVFLEWASSSSSQEIMSIFFLPNFKACLFFVSLYGFIGMAALTLLMRHYAPANEQKAGALIGFAAAMAGALGYSFHCPIDSPTFIATAYGLPTLAITLISRFAVPRFIRW